MKANNHVPVYVTIFSELRDRIVNGSLGPGEMLPSENELCAKYRASRETIRKGLKQLEQAGLIYSSPRRGYFVNTPQHNKFTLSFSQDIGNGEVRFKDIRIIRPTAEIQEALNIPSNRKVIAFYRGNYKGERQIGLEIKYVPYDRGLPTIEDEINFAVFPEAADAKATSFSYYTELNIQAVTASGEILSMLDCSPEDPLLLLKRTYITQSGEHIGYSKQYLIPPYGELHGVSGYVQKNTH
ncbi:GntR family transcriptional regulator [Fusibacillus kribbianus]|uniref:GntR family transcriptional regulator n=1 Tax=Fusibacillus kribbianus TaxID=3044208 RepID=A0AAP4BAN3_9FIRM|nr:GntR family transcriptional regulator [Ruminococcus sp. YH-rum2234]MDI9241778.1 GntR family transcriptional regulator [Ruminococcus sp. YH-rum2234]